MLRPMKTFRNLAPDLVHTGPGALAQLTDTLSLFGAKSVFVMTTQSLRGEVGRVESILGEKHLATYSDCKQHSPSANVDDAAAIAGEADAIISFGGGSVIDTTKAVAARLGHLPQIAIPTTLSAGEFTPGIGITDENKRVKDVSMDVKAIPRAVIHDPQLTEMTPEHLWLSTGIKALDHAIEALWWEVEHPMVDLYASDAAQRLLTWLPKSRAAADLEARENCFLGAWMGIQSVYMCGARLSHPVGHQLGAAWGIPHGVTSCIALPASMRALNEVTPAVGTKVAPLFGTKDGNAAADELTKFVADLGLPTRLRETDAVEAEIPQVASAIEHEFQTTGRKAEVDIEGLLRAMW